MLFRSVRNAGNRSKNLLRNTTSLHFALHAARARSGIGRAVSIPQRESPRKSVRETAKPVRDVNHKVAAVRLPRAAFYVCEHYILCRSKRDNHRYKER